MIQYLKFGSAGERSVKEAKTTGKSNSFREKKQRKNRHFKECTKWVEDNLHKVAKIKVSFEWQGKSIRWQDRQPVRLRRMKEPDSSKTSLDKVLENMLKES